MNKYIDADRLMAQIDRIEEDARKVRVSGTDKEAIGADGKVKLCLELKSIIDSLQQEQPEVDLDEETIRIEFHTIADKCFNEGIEGWEREKLIARHFFNLGRNARKEENK